MGQIAKKLNEQPQGFLPSNTVTNPREQVNAITLRSGIVLEEVEQKGKDENPPKEKEESDEEIEEEIIVEEKPTSPIKEESKREKMPKQKKEKLPFPEIPPKLAHHTPPVPFPQRLRKQNQDKQFTKFLDMSSYAKFLKEILSNKRKLEEEEIVMLTEECSSSINLMHFSSFRKLEISEVKPTTISLQLADRSIKHPRGIIEDVLVKVDKFIFSADFFVLDMKEDKEIPLILGRPFLATRRALIDVQERKLIMRLQGEEVTFNVLETQKFPSKQESCFKIDLVDQSAIKTSKLNDSKSPFKQCMVKSEQIEDEDHKPKVYTTYLDEPQSSKCLHKGQICKDLGIRSCKTKVGLKTNANREITSTPSQFKNADGKLKYRKGVDENARILKRKT
ncbi:uncharacterized protein LOC116141982 [Pistacia vera]|uniref:uncharacterized protein LOC116141982 n=1 Tax=Pistacia vera TaxID=55513 RepID=UPI001262F907|nr:uncharacterized protein LOC116141982 [Pistacia vera]